MEAYAFRELELKQASRRRRARGPVAALTLTAAAAKPIAKKGGEIEKAVAPVVPDLGAVLKKASATAFRGGMAGFAAGVVQARSATASIRLLGSAEQLQRACRWAPLCGCAPS